MAIAPPEFGPLHQGVSSLSPEDIKREGRLTERQTTLRVGIKWVNRFRIVLLLIGIVFAIMTVYYGTVAISLHQKMAFLYVGVITTTEETERHALETAFQNVSNKYDDALTSILGGAIIATPMLLWCLVLSPRSRQNELIDASNELDLLSIPSISYEQKAQKLLQMQQLELKRYYSQTLYQSSYIFWVGVSAMIVGVAVVAGTIYYVHSWGQDTFEKSIIGIVGAVGGILINFVGVMYLRMFSEIVKGVTHSYDALVTMNHLHLANLFLADISDKELREKTLAELALGLGVSLANRPAASNRNGVANTAKVA